MSDLSKRNSRPLAVVTGGTKGIGRAILRRFAAGGFDVATTSRHEKDLENLRKETEAEFPGCSVQVLAADLGQRQEVDRFAAFVAALDRPADLLVNNTGVFLPGAIHTEAEGTFETLMQVNVASAYHLTRALVSGMMARQKGYVVNICSTASITAYTNGGSYCISKYALLGMTKVLREELKTHQVKVTAILPGATLTDSWAGTDLPESRFMSPEDVAELLWTCYHLSPSAVVEEILVRPQLGDL